MEWHWIIAIAAGVPAFMLAIELLSRWTNDPESAGLSLDDEDEDADGSDTSNADVDE